MIITDHRFVGLRQWGISADDDKPCQFVGCGRPASWHKQLCKGALVIKGEWFKCEEYAPHNGLAHSNKEAEAIWQ